MCVIPRVLFNKIVYRTNNNYTSHKIKSFPGLGSSKFLNDKRLKKEKSIKCV